jgi:hypothetical protein
MIVSEAIKKYGSETWAKMSESGWLDGITVTIGKNGETDIPQSDLDRAYRAIQGKPIHPLDWD